MTSLKIGSNISSLKAQRQLSKATGELSTIYERLSSGLRINKASDDSAGISIVSSLESDKRVYSQGIRNLNDGISLLNIADGTLNELSSIVTRLQELAEQSSNGVYSLTQRKALDAEAQALSQEYFRVERSTTFNGKSLFAAEFGNLALQAGYGANGGITSNLGGAISTGAFSQIFTNTNTGAQDSALGDLNGDGNLDMVSANGTSLYVSLGTGGGAFAAGVAYTTASSTQSLALGDMNNDGILDIISAGATGRVSTMLGNVNGSFGSASDVTLNPAATLRGLSLGDINGDGNLDFMIGDSTVYAYLGNGSGSYSLGATYLNESTLYDTHLADLNNDGILDMITAGFDFGASSVSTRLGTGSGTFGARSANSFGAAGAVYSIEAKDLNADGKLDLITGGTFAGSARSFVQLGNGDGTAGAAVTYNDGTGTVYDIAIEDLNGDGFKDYVSAASIGGLGVGFVRLGNGTGTLGTAVSYSIGAAGNSIGVGDLNNDGVYDLASSTANRLSDTTYGVSPLLSFSLKTKADSLQALSEFNKASQRLSSQRGQIGAFQSRLGFAANNLSATVENYASAASRIKDADIASEAANLVRMQILQQAATAVLAQANQQPGIALKLLALNNP